MILRIALCWLFICLLSANLYGQSPYLGFKLGYNTSSLSSSNDSERAIESRPAYNLSLTHSNYYNNSNLGYTIELGYTLKGVRVDHDTLDYKFHYLNLPLLFDVYPVKKVKLSIGSEFSYLIGARNQSASTAQYSILNTYNKRFEVSGIASASCSVTYFIDMGFRYSYSFTKVSEFDPALNRRDLYNRYFQFFVLFKIAN